MARLSFLLLVYALFQLVNSQNADSWINPPNAGKGMLFLDDPTLTIGEKIELEWVTSKEEYGIYLWQQSLTIGSAVLGLSIYTKIIGGAEAGRFNWTITQQAFDISQSNVFWLSLGPNQDNLTDCMTSHYFNLTITDETAAPTTTNTASSITPSSTSSSTAAPNPDTTGAATIPSQSNTTNPNREQDQGSSLAAKVGLGVGLGVGIPLLLVIAYLAVTHVRKTRKKQHALTSQMRIREETLSDNTKSSPQELSGFDRWKSQPAQDSQSKWSYSEGLSELPDGRQSVMRKWN